jgi:hypothetical protein
MLACLPLYVSNDSNREGWAFIDALPDDQVCSTPESAKLPIALHYCKR